MLCPQCQSETAFAPFSAGLICLDENCEWSRSLNEDQIHRLLFGRREIDAPDQPESEPESEPEGERLTA